MEYIGIEMNKVVITVLFVIIILLGAGLGIVLFQNQKLLKGLSAKPEATTISTTTDQRVQEQNASPAPSPKIQTLLEVQKALEENTNQKDHKGLLQYTKSGKINFIIMSSSCCEPKSPEEAVSGISYIDEGIPFDFNQDTTTVKNLKSKNERLKDAYIGISKNKEHLVAYTIDSQNLIVQIEVSVSWKLYNQ